MHITLSFYLHSLRLLICNFDSDDDIMAPVKYIPTKLSVVVVSYKYHDASKSHKEQTVLPRCRSTGTGEATGSSTRGWWAISIILTGTFAVGDKSKLEQIAINTVRNPIVYESLLNIYNWYNFFVYLTFKIYDPGILISSEHAGYLNTRWNGKNPNLNETTSRGLRSFSYLGLNWWKIH